ncbi:D-alanyl-D-alanine carboxypeptidase family protein [Bauldia sp.]|uniref:D-alanyl-D-alanine carboxypeptidase family protein n=1 Tax=Bauldia sp. TaxID=2575872 RepID=UPI003BAA196D
MLTVLGLGVRAICLSALALATVVAVTLPANAQLYQTKAKQAFLVDYDTGTVLFEKNADEPFPPASMAKLMTLAVVFRAIDEGRLSRDDEFVVSENAWRTGGAVSRTATMFAELGSSIRVVDLIRGAIVQSGNDSCIIMAEGMAGTEPAFVAIMNDEAEALGLSNSRFGNSTGLAGTDQRVTARDLATLADHLIRSYPDLYAIFSEPDFTWNNIFQKNRNPLVPMNIGADGLKTGFTEESGYGLTGSAVRDGQRLIVVVAGLESEKARAQEARKLLDWGFRAFEPVELFGGGEVIADAKVFGGTQRSVNVVSDGPVELLLPVGLLDVVKAEIVYDGPVVAPVTAGQRVGVVSFTTIEGLSKAQPVLAAEDVGVGSLPQRAVDGLEELLFGWW